MTERILQAYGITPKRILPVQKGYRNESHAVELPDGRFINLILYKSEPGILSRIKRANMVGDFLAQAGLPARQTFDPKIIQLTAENRTKYGALYNYLPGSTIPWEAYTQHHIKLLGLAMGRMHHILQNMPNQHLLKLQPYSAVDEYEALLERMTSYFSQPGVQKALRAKLRLQPPLIETYQQTLQQARQLPNHQTLHMDFVRGNILFDVRHPGLEPGPSKKRHSLTDRIPNQVGNDKGLVLGSVTLTGILDFEKAALGPVVFDVARTLAFLWVDSKFKTEPQIRKYFLLSGYLKRGGGSLDPASTKLLEPLLDLFLLHDFYKFLRHNPYQSLADNQHYCRTVAILQQRGVLQA